MKIKMKKTLVAAAIGAMAMSGAANAAISTSAGGELFVVAYDSVAQDTFIATLNSITPTAASFTGASNLSKSFAADANWTAFTSTVGFNAANVTYQVLGIDTATKSLWTTSNDMGTSAGLGSAYNLITAATGSFYTWLGYNAPAGAGASVLVAPGANGNGAQIGNNWSNYLNRFTTTAALGADDQFYKLTKTSTNNLLPLTKSQYMQSDLVTPGVWNLGRNGTLAYTAAAVAAVPEADTSVMFLAGLGLMGFIARRRMQA